MDPQIIPNNDNTPTSLEIINVIPSNMYYLMVSMNIATDKENIFKNTSNSIITESTTVGTIKIDSTKEVIKHYTISLEHLGCSKEPNVSGRILHFTGDF